MSPSPIKNAYSAISAHQSAAHPQRPCPMAATPHINVQGLLFSYPPLLALPWSHLTHVYPVLSEPGSIRTEGSPSWFIFTSPPPPREALAWSSNTCPEGLSQGQLVRSCLSCSASHLHTVQTTAARDIVFLFQNQPITSRNTASMENTGQFYSS